MSDQAVREKTGRDWRAWCELLDREGAADISHADIARHLADRHELPGWWAQTVTVGYERARGRRRRNERPDGFQISASKTVGVSLDVLYAAWTDADRRAAWLDPRQVAFHRETPPKYLRGRWTADDTPVDLGFVPRGDGKSQVSVTQRRIPSAEVAEERRDFWKRTLAEMKRTLEMPGASGA